MIVQPKLQVMVIGQVPPPFGGQTIMTEVLLRGRYPGVDLIHVDLAVSSSLADMNGFSTRKVSRLTKVLIQALWLWVRLRPSILYYHPAGSSKSAIYRDLVLLPFLRPLFRTVVFHLHARGLVEACESLSSPLKHLARRAYIAPDFLIGPSAVIVDEASSLSARVTRVIPNATAGGSPKTRYEDSDTVRILFLNLISEPKGSTWLLNAFAELRRSGVDAQLILAGECKSAAYRETLLERAKALGIQDRVTLPGVVVGDNKWKLLQSADVFCVPTTWPQESFGLVLIEAASCGLPVIATDVPGVRDVLEPGVSVMLADPDDPASLERYLRILCQDSVARRSLGTAARRAFEERYTEDRYWRDLGEVFTIMREERRQHAAA